MNENNKVTRKIKIVRKRKKDFFWPIIIFLSGVSFIASYWVFYNLTSNVNTKTIKTSKPIVIKSKPPEEESKKVVLIGDGRGGTPVPEIKLEDILEEPELTENTPVLSIAPTIEATPIPTPVPTPIPTQTPKPIPQPTKIPKVEPPKEKKIYFKVRVGAYSDNFEANKVSKELEEYGYITKIISEPEGFYVQLGAFGEQEKALILAEEISEKGYAVIIRQIES